MFKSLYRKKSNEPMERYVYFITDGIYKGTQIMFFNVANMPIDGVYKTLAIGDSEDREGGMGILDIPEDALKEAFENNIIDCYKKMDKTKWNIFKKEYDYRVNKQKEDQINEK